MQVWVSLRKFPCDLADDGWKGYLLSSKHILRRLLFPWFVKAACLAAIISGELAEKVTMEAFYG